MKRCFSAKQRRYLYLLAGGKCEMCDADLSASFHGDHRQAFSRGGETALHNGQALCPKCNLEKGSKEMNTPVLRNWQGSMLAMLKQKWEDSRRKREIAGKILVAACPGSGKTLAACCAAYDEFKAGNITLVLVVVPTVNIKKQWKEQFERMNVGINVIDNVSNEEMRFRMARGSRIVGDYDVICVTYNQLAMDKDLFVELSRRERTMLIADEIHHADDSEAFGMAVEAVAEKAMLKLALSGTPFNSSGGSLAMCPSKEIISNDGRVIRKAMPDFIYSYGQALQDMACRPVEFIKVYGVGKSTYRSLANNETFQKIVDLSKQNKTDSIGMLLDPDGDFLKSMLEDGLRSLYDIKRHDKRAGMLIVAKDKEHGSRIAAIISDLCRKNNDWRNYSALEVYNDTDNAHDRIKQLDNDNTDIVITVRMISEGVDVRRLRVGVYATDYRTRMFFIQFIGRFVRWESRLDGTQHGRVVIPAHIDLLEYAREIERMIDEALVSDGGDASIPTERKSEFVFSETQRTDDGVIYKGQEMSERDLAEEFFSKFPSLRGKLPEVLAIQAAKDANLSGSTHVAQNPTSSAPNYWKANEQLVRAIVKNMKLNGDDDDQLFKKVNFAANRHVGIPRVDKLVSADIMKKRLEFLKSWCSSVKKNQEFNYAS